METFYTLLAAVFIFFSALLFASCLASLFGDYSNSSYLIRALAAFLLLNMALLAMEYSSMSSADASARRVTCDATNGAEGEAHTWHCTLIDP